MPSIQSIIVLVQAALTFGAVWTFAPSPHLASATGPAFESLDLTWSLESVDTQGVTGWCTSIALGPDPTEAPMIVSADMAAHPTHGLRFSSSNGTDWATETILSGGLWCPELAVDSTRVTISTAVYTPYHSILGVVERQSGKWAFQAIDNETSGRHSLAILPDGRRAIAYPSFIGGYDGVLLALENGTGWEISTVVPPTSYRGICCMDLAFWNGTFAIGYLKPTSDFTADVEIVVGDGKTWRVETAARNATETWEGNRWIAFDSVGGLHLLYANMSNNLYYAQREAGWTPEQIDHGSVPGSVVYYSLAMGADDRPRVVYEIGLEYRFMYAERRPSGWLYSRVSEQIDCCFLPSLTVDREGLPHIAFVDGGWPQQTYDLWYATARRGPENHPPSAELRVEAHLSEGSATTLQASGSSDSDGDALQFRWDFDHDGTWDTAYSPQSSVTHTWGDDFVGQAALEVSDGNLTSVATVPIGVTNVAPTLGPLNLRATGQADLIVRVAGTKYARVEASLYRNGELAASATITRVPGSPDEQSVRLGKVARSSDEYRMIISFLPSTTSNSGRAGGTPVWVILEQGDNGTILHHTFASRRSSTWAVEDLGAYVGAHVVTSSLSIRDQGSDDLMVKWEFGDGTTQTQTFLNDPTVGADPFPSPDVSPRSVSAEVIHAYALSGTYTVTVTVLDDDGGTVVARATVNIP